MSTNRNEYFDLLDDLDEGILAESETAKLPGLKAKRRGKILGIAAVLAACLVLAATIGIAAGKGKEPAPPAEDSGIADVSAGESSGKSADASAVPMNHKSGEDSSSDAASSEIAKLVTVDFQGYFPRTDMPIGASLEDYIPVIPNRIFISWVAVVLDENGNSVRNKQVSKITEDIVSPGNIVYLSTYLDYDYDRKTFQYTVNEDGKTCTIISVPLCELKKDTIVFPAEIDGYKVTVIGPRMFFFGNDTPDHWSGGKKVVVPEGVEIISEFAFLAGDNLSVCLLPSTLKQIGFEAFDSRKLDLTIPGNVTFIGTYAVYAVNSLTFEKSDQPLTLAPKALDHIESEVDYYAAAAESRSGKVTMLQPPVRYTVNADGKTCTLHGVSRLYQNEYNNLMIPGEVDGYTVTVIAGDIAVLDEDGKPLSIYSNASSIVIPRSVTTMEDGIFNNQHFDLVMIPVETTSIGCCFDNHVNGITVFYEGTKEQFVEVGGAMLSCNYFEFLYEIDYDSFCNPTIVE